jgi:hypothetical protein
MPASAWPIASSVPFGVTRTSRSPCATRSATVTIWRSDSTIPLKARPKASSAERGVTVAVTSPRAIAPAVPAMLRR